MRRFITAITIPEFITHVKLSNKRRAKYYTKKSKIPKKYKELKFKNGFLVDVDGKKVVSNPRSVGTPKLKKINGQEIYSGMPHHMRAKIVKTIKDFYKKHLKNIDPVDSFPIQIEMELHAPIEVGNWDLDNLWIYNKCFQDALTDLGIIPDDNIQYITKPASPLFFPVENMEDRKLVYRIYSDDREVILQNPYYEKVSEVREEEF